MVLLGLSFKGRRKKGGVIPERGHRTCRGHKEGSGRTWGRPVGRVDLGSALPGSLKGTQGPRAGLGWWLLVGGGVRLKPTAGLRGGEDAAGVGSRVQVRWEWWPGVGRQWVDFRCF